MDNARLFEIVDKLTPHYFVKMLDGEAYLLLYYPAPPYKRLGNGYAYVSAHYVAYTRLYWQCKTLLTQLKEFGATAFNGNLKRLFKDTKSGIYLKNNLIAIPPYGTRVSLMAIKLCGDFCERSADFDASKRLCEGCGLCVAACPTAALSDGFVATKCLRYQMDFYKNSDADFGLLQGGLIGCEHCQGCCPYNFDLPMVEMEEGLKQQLCIKNILECCLKGRKALAQLAQYIGTNYAKPDRLAFFALNAIQDRDTAQLAGQFLDYGDRAVAEKAKSVMIRHDIPF